MNFSIRTYFSYTIFIFLFIAGCNYQGVDKKKEWIEQYAQTKCEWKQQEDALVSDSIRIISPMVNEREQLFKELEILSAPFNERIKVLQNEINDEQEFYSKEYRRLTDNHYEKYGHVSTPEYEKSLERIKQNRSDRVSILNEKINTIKDEMKKDSNYQKVMDKINLIENQIKEQDNILESKRQPTFDSLQAVLNEQNRKFKMMLNDMETEEKQSFEEKRDSIRKNPCRSNRNSNEIP